MSVKPIRFTTDEVRATLDGRKTVKRLAVKDYDKYERLFGIELIFPMQAYKAFNSPCEPGDILWVRETFRIDYLSNIVGSGRVHYKADGSFGDLHFQPARYDMMRRAQLKPGWRPNENMPREAARIWLRVTGVRVERLQEIDEDGAIAEGCSAGRFETTGGPWGVEDNPDEWTAREDFSRIWDSAIKPVDRDRYGWAANPWVWVIAFERCEKPEEG